MEKLKKILKENDITILENPFYFTIMLGYSKKKGYYIGKTIVGKSLEEAIEKTYDFLTGNEPKES